VTVLDTHAWVWWVSESDAIPKRLTKRLHDEGAQGRLFVSSISTWEVALLVKSGRLRLTMDVAEWIAKTEALPAVQFVPVDNNIALKSVTLPGTFHNDPADRMIVATAMVLGATLVTKDEKIRRYKHISSVW